MRRLKILETPYYSYLQGVLAEGCKRCVKGEKLVLFITGVCPNNCFFCPLSEEKKDKDLIYANEKPIVGDEETKFKELIEETKASKSTGAGITGGDPLARLDRTCKYIKKLKEVFGKNFHIHLYTPPILVTETSLKKLYDAGLDEIRFHPDLEDDKLWNNMLEAKKFNWDVGVEIPVFPDKVEKTKKLIDYLASNELISFLNLNELEISELTADTFAKRGYHVVSAESYGIEGSKEAALELMSFAQNYNLTVHYCTTKLKDRIQMGNRILRRSENEEQPFDEVDEEGLLTRGAIYINYPPEGNYKRILSNISDIEFEEELARLQEVYAWLRDIGMPEDAGKIDEARLRIILSAEAVVEIAKEIKEQFKELTLAIVTEYPTSDAFIVSFEPQ